MTPTPLFFQVPEGVLDEALRGASASIGPDFLCFESVYQAVANTWPRTYSVVDLGGFIGLQGWLFRRFADYVDVDSFDMRIEHDGERCRLPVNGLHVTSTIQDYMQPWVDMLPFGYGDDVEMGRTLFVCSGVPDREARDLALSMPNHVVWYPDELMMCGGAYAWDTLRYFDELCASSWRTEADEAIWEHVMAHGMLD